MEKKIIVYSILTNGYDKLNNPKVYDPSIDYILFTDDMSLKSDVWKIYPIDFVPKNLESRKANRYIKINSHLVLPEHDISIYIDHCLEPRFNDANKMINDMKMETSNIISYKHSKRNCLYDESNEVLRLSLDSPIVVNAQLKRYYSMGFPPNYGLYEAGFLIRKNNLKVKLFNETWWKEVFNNSGRDQLSQMFASWSTGIDIHPITIGKNVWSNDLLHPKTEHLKRFSTNPS
jgi:hypothetical protein